MLSLGVLLAFAAGTHLSTCQSVPLRGPPMFELFPQYSDSYIPASMQIIAYLTEMMKYDMKPTAPVTSISTTTTSRPTSSHKPGLYAPMKPPGPLAFYHTGNRYNEYVNWVNSLGGQTLPVRKSSDAVKLDDDFQAIMEALRKFEPAFRDTNVEDLDLLGDGPHSLHKLVNGIDDDDKTDDDDVRVQKFSENFDDSDFRHYIASQKRAPPTRAYVTLLSLYDLLNKESKRLALNKFNGFSQKVLKDLTDTSSGTSAYQLKYVLNKIIEKKNTNDQAILKKVNTVIDDLNQDASYINVALRYIPALPFEP